MRLKKTSQWDRYCVVSAATLMEQGGGVGACFFSMHNPMFLGILSEVVFAIGKKTHKEELRGL